jgi:sugar phosphate permease
MVPLVINPGQSIYLSLLYDGAAAAGYLYMLTFLSHSDKWFWGLGLPIVVYVTVIVELTALCFYKLPKSFLIRGICVITAIGFLCAGIEMLIDRYAVGTVELRWSAVVLTVCIIIDIVLITTMSLRRVRAAVRKRLHF